MTTELTMKVEFLKSKEGNEYLALYIDLGYTRKILSVDRCTIAELIDVSIRELYRIVRDCGTIEFGVFLDPKSISHD